MIFKDPTKFSMKKYISTFLLFFITLSGNFLFAQIPVSETSLNIQNEYSIQTWTTENGLPQNSINDIVQTADGFLWLATFDGLVRFDGVSFKTYTTKNTLQFKTNGIKRLFVDNENRLWIITIEGALLCYDKNIFFEYELPEKINMENNSIADFGKESVIVMGYSGKLYLLKNKHFEPFSTPVEGIICIQTLNSNHLFIGTTKGLYSFINNVLFKFDELKNTGVNSIVKDLAGNIYACAPGEIYIIHQKKCVLYSIPVNLNFYKDYHLKFNENNSPVIYTDKGLLICKEKKARAITIENGLSSNSIRSFFVDKQYNLWVGTNNGGLNKLRYKLFKTYTKEDGMIDDGVSAITETEDGTILIGNNCGGVNEFKNEKFITNLIQPVNNCVWSIMKDDKNNIWVGTYGGGITVYYKNKTIKQFEKKIGLLSNDIFSIYEDSKKNIWIGTSNGLNKYQNGTFTTVDSSFKNVVTYITEDKNGDIWLGTGKGLAIIKNNKIKLFTKTDGINTGSVRYIYEDAEGIKWIGTRGNGLIRLKNENFFSFAEYTAQLDNNVWCIIEDEKGNLWMSSNSGMYIVSRKELNNFADNNSHLLSPVYLSKEDGLKSNEFNGGFQSPALKSSKGELWFPTVKGVARVSSRDVQAQFYVPHIIIEQIFIDDKQMRNEDSVTTYSSSNNIIVRFTAPSFINPLKLSFQYKLEGVNSNWIDIGVFREIKINQIPDGKHILRIRLSNTFNNKETSIAFIKPIPFWKNLEIIFSIIFLFIIVVIFITISAISKIRKREQQKTLLNKKYANIELKALQAQMNPHFIFNCLNAIQHYVVINDELSASKYLTKFSILMRKFLEHSKSNSVTLQEEIELLRLYIELENMRFKNGFNFIINIDPAIDIFNTEIPSMLFQPFVENAINHGLFYLDRKGTLTLDLKSDKNYIVGIIDDDGVGRKKGVGNVEFPKKERVSRGTELINERIQVLNSIEGIEIGLQIIDKTDINNLACGTTVIITIPINEH